MTNPLLAVTGRRAVPRYLKFVVAGVTAATLIGSALLHGGESSAQPAPVPETDRAASLTVTTLRLAPVDLTRSVTVNGAVYPWQEVIIGPEVGGYRVTEVLVEVGDRVRTGQELVRLSTALLAADVATRQAMIKQREAELLNARAASRRATALSAQAALSAADLDRLRSEELAAEARLESARSDHESASLKLQYTRVTAPDDGVITARSVNVGQIAQVGTEMLRLLRQDRVEWRGEVPEARLADVRIGQQVRITIASGAELAGKVRIVAPTIASSNRTGLVYVDVPHDERVRPGMFARGEIEVGQAQALQAPLASVINSDGYSYVFVLRPDNTVERRRVDVGAISAGGIELTGGVVAGEVLVERGAGFLKDGDKVNVVEGRSS
ncbi:MAG: efflux RND transporter periplasmic adaptor subunit [Gammaproteobacteria bacterium]|nr:efflux RND transporter periplasmic adaptor subunit [Gammaproteobacteria bacterium]